MSLERTEVSKGSPLFKPGHYILTLDEVKKGRTPKSRVYFIFKFSFEYDGERKKYSEFLMSFLCEEMLRALQAPYDKEEKAFIWDTLAITGRQVSADIIVEPDYKNPLNERNKLKNIKPYPPTEEVGSPAEIDEEAEIPF